MPSALPVVSRRRVLVGTAALAALGAHRRRVRQAATATRARRPASRNSTWPQRQSTGHRRGRRGHPADVARALTQVASERSEHAQALSDEIARITGKPTTSTTTTTTTGATPANAPTAEDVVAALRKSADSAGQLAAQLSGYRAGLLGSIAASCTAAYTVALAPGGGAS